MGCEMTARMKRLRCGVSSGVIHEELNRFVQIEICENMCVLLYFFSIFFLSFFFFMLLCLLYNVCHRKCFESCLKQQFDKN